LPFFDDFNPDYEIGFHRPDHQSGVMHAPFCSGRVDIMKKSGDLEAGAKCQDKL
jgi:hypothetical protein